MNATLIGMKHCGKSTLGAALARRWGCAFYDVDGMIEERQACETGERLTVREIFARQGEGRFRELETAVVCELCLRLSGETGSHVVAVGGRTALNEKVGELLGGLGVVVYLEVSPEELFARVQRGGLPPFLDQADPAMDFLALYRKRAPYYRRLADLAVNLDGLGVEAALEKLVRSLEEHDRAGKPGR